MTPEFNHCDMDERSFVEIAKEMMEAKDQQILRLTEEVARLRDTLAKIDCECDSYNGYTCTRCIALIPPTLDEMVLRMLLAEKQMVVWKTAVRIVEASEFKLFNSSEPLKIGKAYAKFHISAEIFNTYQQAKAALEKGEFDGQD